VIEAAALSFGGMAALDFVWARYATACADRRRFPAAAWASVLTAVNMITTLVFVDSQSVWLLIPLGLGAFAGTWYGMPQ
jgi:hypothetical protein